VIIVGAVPAFAGELQAPCATLLTDATRVNVVAPHGIASMFTVLPARPLETVPESVSAPP
jgi:hypothetical protein